jgi:hypothetical protein
MKSQSVVPFHFTIGPDPGPLRLRPVRGGPHLTGQRTAWRGVASATLSMPPGPSRPRHRGVRDQRGMESTSGAV